MSEDLKSFLARLDGRKLQEQNERAPDAFDRRVLQHGGFSVPPLDVDAEIRKSVDMMDIETLTLLMKYGWARLVTLLGELEGKAARARAELGGL